MGKTLQQEVLGLRRRVRQLEGNKSAEDALPFLRAPSSGRESFDDQVAKQNNQKIDENAARASAYLRHHPREYAGMGASDKLAKDFDIPIGRAMGLLQK